MTLARHPIVIVTPVYEDAEARGRLFKELFQLFGRDAFVVAEDDGSVNRRANGSGKNPGDRLADHDYRGAGARTLRRQHVPTAAGLACRRAGFGRRHRP